MATVRWMDLRGSSEIFRNYNLSRACDRSYCDLINSEIKVLQSDVKCLTEIVNILNNDLKTRISIVPNEADVSACDNCMQLETKLLKANEEISSPKLIIDLLMDSKHSKLATQPQQVNLKPGNIHRSMRIPCVIRTALFSLRRRSPHLIHRSMNDIPFQLRIATRY